MSYASKTLYRLFPFLVAIHVHVLFYIQLVDLCLSFLEIGKWLMPINICDMHSVSCRNIQQLASINSWILLLFCLVGWFVCFEVFGDQIVSNFKTTMIFRRWVLGICKRQATCVTNTVLKFTTYDNLGHLYMIHNIGRKAIMPHTGQLKNFFVQHKSCCSYGLLPVALEISVMSQFQKYCQLLSLYTDSMQNWSL